MDLIPRTTGIRPVSLLYPVSILNYYCISHQQLLEVKDTWAEIICLWLSTSTWIRGTQIQSVNSEIQFVNRDHSDLVLSVLIICLGKVLLKLSKILFQIQTVVTVTFQKLLYCVYHLSRGCQQVPWVECWYACGALVHMWLRWVFIIKDFWFLVTFQMMVNQNLKWIEEILYHANSFE